MNEGIENVIYICATIDLVQQTSNEAKRIGLDHTLRIKSDFDNDLFESGKAFCITTYHALFNGHSAIRKSIFPVRSFSMTRMWQKASYEIHSLSRSRKKNIKICSLKLPHYFINIFKDLRIEGPFKDSLSREHRRIVLAAPSGLYAVKERLSALLDKHQVSSDKNQKYAYEYLRDRLDCCAALFGDATFELSPPFMPSLAIDVFQANVRRVYLSATLRSKSDFVRAFGRLPDVHIEPDSDAGNGERLILLADLFLTELHQASLRQSRPSTKPLSRYRTIIAQRNGNVLGIHPSEKFPHN